MASPPDRRRRPRRIDDDHCAGSTTSTSTMDRPTRRRRRAPPRRCRRPPRWSTSTTASPPDRQRPPRLSTGFPDPTRGKNNVVDLDVLDAFAECHTSKKMGLSDAAQEALLAIKTMMEDLEADDDAPRSSSENSALLREEVDTLKEAEIADEALAKINQQQEENNLLLRRILSLSQNAGVAQTYAFCCDD
uniref:Uncharacterized protein n=2 Tax=Leersia perrieri TaxID=77586 RepID=A0A0D9X3B9_9ORYZ